MFWQIIVGIYFFAIEIDPDSDPDPDPDYTDNRFPEVIDLLHNYQLFFAGAPLLQG
jgi:hypothetical protein